MARNPEENKFGEFIESSANDGIRNRGMSFTSTKIEPDFQLNR